MREIRQPTRTILPFLAVTAAICLVAPLGDSLAVTTEKFRLPEGKIHDGNVYLVSGTTDIAGTLEGDLISLTRAFTLGGTVTDDVLLCSRNVEVTGTIGDSLRACGQFLTVAGTIEGDLLAFGQTVTLMPGARVGGDLIAFGAELVIDGDVQGKVRAWAGDAYLDGTVGKRVLLRCDTMHVGPEARIGGDLIYTARREVDLEGKGIVGGRIEYRPPDEGGGDRGRSLLDGRFLLWRGGLWAAALLVGFAGIALFGGPARSIAATVGGRTLSSLGIGFLLIVVTPIAGALLLVLILTIPLALLLIGLFLMAVYLAKLPVALWLGRTLLTRLGRPSPSPYGAMLVGLLVLYLLFLIPYVGWLVWAVCLVLGLGAIVLGIAASARDRRIPAASSPAAAS